MRILNAGLRVPKLKSWAQTLGYGEKNSEADKIGTEKTDASIPEINTRLSVLTDYPRSE